MNWWHGDTQQGRIKNGSDAEKNTRPNNNSNNVKQWRYSWNLKPSLENILLILLQYLKRRLPRTQTFHHFEVREVLLNNWPWQWIYFVFHFQVKCCSLELYTHFLKRQFKVNSLQHVWGELICKSKIQIANLVFSQIPIGLNLILLSGKSIF